MRDRDRLAVTLATAALGCAAVPAAAAASQVSTFPDPDRSNETVARYVAAPGEVNDVRVVSVDVFTVRIADPGAVIAAGTGCTSIDVHTVQCASPMPPSGSRRFLDFVALRLGDGNDRASSAGPGFNAGLRANGGAGDDVLTGDDLADTLDGGGGRDELHGGGNSDTLRDGDAAASPDADLLDGGADRDTASYAARSARVRVDLAEDRGGQAGEGDTLRAIESATGGSGPDRLAGDGRANSLDGRGGADRIDGRGGDDFLDGRSGRDVIHGGRGGDVIAGGSAIDRLFGEPGADIMRPGTGSRESLTCGRGSDTGIGIRARDTLEPGCEDVVFGFGPSGEDSFSATAYPTRRTSATATFALGCPRPEELDGLSEAISGRVRLREAGGRQRSLGSGRITNGRRCESDPAPQRIPVVVALNALGRRLGARDGGVRTSVFVGGRNLPSVGWSIRLRLP
jgi:hypothetical protein